MSNNSNVDIILEWNGKEIKVPKILRGYIEKHQITKSELKRMKLMPDAPPIGYSFQQFNGDVANKKLRLDTVMKNKKVFGKNFKKDQWVSIVELAANSARQVQTTLADMNTNLKDQDTTIRKHEV